MTALDAVLASLLAERYAGEWWPTEKHPELPDELAGVRRRRELAEEVEMRANATEGLTTGSTPTYLGGSDG